MTAAKTPVAVLISGRGSNMRALIEACEAADFPARIALVLANNADAKGLQTARDYGIEAIVLDHRSFAAREDFEAALDARLRAAGVRLVCLAGFMRLLGPAFVHSWQGALVNIHPSLLPAFKGLGTHQRALQAGVREHGCTVHFVSPGMDEGEIIARSKVPVLPDDTPDSLAARVLKAEHILYPACLRQLALGQTMLERGSA